MPKDTAELNLEIVEDYEVSLTEVLAAREKAQERVQRWDWNYNLPQIARELIDEEIEPDSWEGEVILQEMLDYFGRDDEHQRKAYANYWSIISDIVEEFG